MHAAWGDQISYISQNEEVARICRSESIGNYAAVRTGDEESVGRLSRGKPPKRLSIPLPHITAEFYDSLDQFLHGREFSAFCARGLCESLLLFIDFAHDFSRFFRQEEVKTKKGKAGYENPHP